MRKTKTTKSFSNLLRAFSVFAAFRKTIETEEILKKMETEEETEDKYRRIRCPLCRWQPGAASRWFCADCDAPEFFYNGCGASWNTFETGGRCPGCRHRWRWTSCLKCGGWARHEDWYEK